MEGFTCHCCDAVFQNPDIIDETRWEEFWGERVRHHQRTFACPECGSYEVIEANLCPKCKEAVILRGHDYCFFCLPKDALEDDLQEASP